MMRCRKVVFPVSERAAMKRRVRGLLHNNWLQPLCALVLAGLPMLIVTALAFWLFRPSAADIAPAVQFTWIPGDPRAMLVQLLVIFSNPLGLLEPALGWLPAHAISLVVCVFITMPVSTSLAGYFLAFLRGKNPKVMSVFDCFSGRYPRALGGMAYQLLWIYIWFAASFLLPGVLVFAGAPIVSMLGVELSTQIYIFAAMLLVGIVWYIVFFFVFLSRLLAYSLTPVCLSAQPRLPAHRAVRLSRKLMRGSKWRLISLFLSFINYFLPAIIAAILLPVLGLVGPDLGLSEIMQRSLRTFLWVVIFANQLIWLYVAPYMAACFNAFFIERKREALMDDEITQDDLGVRAKDEQPAGPSGKAL